MLELNKVYLGDCLEVMKEIPDGSIDMILCDLPYGTTACSWDVIIPFVPLWKEYDRISKINCAILLFGSEPFTSKLRLSNIENYKYDWVWIKNRGTGISTAKSRPMKGHETISVFYKKPPVYTPVMEITKSKHIFKCAEKNLKRNNTSNSDHHSLGGVYGGDFSKYIYPKSVLYYDTVNNRSKDRTHPTQKPVPLLEYLIKTYTTEGQTILDNCCGSGSTLVAARNLNRKFIGIEKEEKYFNISQERLGY